MKNSILCIDDEPANLDTLERCLRKDYKVFKANSGPEGLAILEKETVDLIICDQQMPEMKGVETLTRSIELSPKSMRILLTGFADLESVVDAINLGQIYRYLTKPWTPQDLLNNIAQALETKTMKEQISLQNMELKKANENLRSLDQLKTDFVLLVNHELKTPLTAMSSYSQLMHELKMDDECKLYLTKIDKSIGRLKSLIDDTLLLTKLQSGSSSESNETLPILDVLKSVDQQISKNYEQRNVSLKIQKNDQNEILVDKKLMAILCRKLLENGYQYSPEKANIEMSIDSDGSQWTWRTKNPIQEKIKKTPEELLSSFSKNEDILNHTGGAGLGLSIVNAIAKLFKGQVELSFDDHFFELNLTFPKIS